MTGSPTLADLIGDGLADYLAHEITRVDVAETVAPVRLSRPARNAPTHVAGYLAARGWTLVKISTAEQVHVG